MALSIRREWQRLRAACRRLDRQTVTVLVAAAVVPILLQSIGSRKFFAAELAAQFPEHQRAILGWAWRCGMHALLGFVLPVLVLRLGFRRSLDEMGLGPGDWRLAGALALLYLPPVALGTWLLSAMPGFQRVYPQFQPAARDWGVFVIAEALFILYWVGWEYLWRGFVLFGTAPRLGHYAIFVQTIPFALLHLTKPLAEQFLAVAGGVALGALVWRCRSFWVAVPIHAVQMLLLDLWCTLRARAGG